MAPVITSNRAEIETAVAQWNESKHPGHKLRYKLANQVTTTIIQDGEVSIHIIGDSVMPQWKHSELPTYAEVASKGSRTTHYNQALKTSLCELSRVATDIASQEAEVHRQKWIKERDSYGTDDKSFFEQQAQTAAETMRKLKDEAQRKQETEEKEMEELRLELCRAVDGSLPTELQGYLVDYVLRDELPHGVVNLQDAMDLPILRTILSNGSAMRVAVIWRLLQVSFS